MPFVLLDLRNDRRRRDFKLLTNICAICKPERPKHKARGLSSQEVSISGRDSKLSELSVSYCPSDGTYSVILGSSGFFGGSTKMLYRLATLWNLFRGDVAEVDDASEKVDATEGASSSDKTVQVYVAQWTSSKSTGLFVSDSLWAISELTEDEVSLSNVMAIDAILGRLSEQRDEQLNALFSLCISWRFSVSKLTSVSGYTEEHEPSSNIESLGLEGML